MWLLKHHAQRKEKKHFKYQPLYKESTCCKRKISETTLQKQKKKTKKRYQKQKCITALTLATAIGRIAIKTNIKSSG